MITKKELNELLSNNLIKNYRTRIDERVWAPILVITFKDETICEFRHTRVEEMDDKFITLGDEIKKELDKRNV